MFLNCPKLISGCRSSGDRSFQIPGPATEKSLFPKLFCVQYTYLLTYELYVYVIVSPIRRRQRTVEVVRDDNNKNIALEKKTELRQIDFLVEINHSEIH